MMNMIPLKYSTPHSLPVYPFPREAPTFSYSLLPAIATETFGPGPPVTVTILGIRHPTQKRTE